MGRSNTLRRGRPAPSESRPSSFQGPGAVGSFARYYAARSLRQGRAGARKRGQVPGSSPLEFGASPQPIPGAHDGRTPRSAPPPLRGAQMPQGSPPHTSGRGALGRSDRWAPFRLEDTGPSEGLVAARPAPWRWRTRRAPMDHAFCAEVRLHRPGRLPLVGSWTAAPQPPAQLFTARASTKRPPASPSRDRRVGAAPRLTSHLLVGVDSSSWREA
jgi:hypothetical protein